MRREDMNDAHSPDLRRAGRTTIELAPGVKEAKTKLLIRQLLIWLAVYLVITAIWFYAG